jgi:quinolinate synthase
MATTAAPVCNLENYLELPDHTLDDRILPRRASPWARECVILGHHYQRDEVIRFADFRGDSYKLSQASGPRRQGRYIVFCGVHFMAESADVLSRPGQVTILPDLNAGCSMADMAEITQVEACWEQLVAAGLTDDGGGGITPITYMNSTAAIKAFCGERGGCRLHLFECPGGVPLGLRAKNPKILFLPDQHLGRNTGCGLGIPAGRNAGLGSLFDQRAA